jgi:hypothetical protein
VLAAASEPEAAVDLALALAQLRPERFARVLADAATLARVVDAAVALGTNTRTPGVLATMDLLRQTLTPVALDQVATVGQRLAERGVASVAAARAWLAATDLTAGRSSLVVADLATCVRRLEASGAGRERVVDLIWSSVTDELHQIRQALLVASTATLSQPSAAVATRA